MKRIIPLFLALLVAAAPAGAQFRRATKQAKEDAKLVVSQLKDEGFKSLDNKKLDDAVQDFLEYKYSEKDVYEVVGKGTSKTLNEAKALAREDAISFYPLGDVVNSFFVYKKEKRKFNVVCYALIRATSKSIRTNGGTASAINSARAEQMEKEARSEAKKMEQQAQKEAQKAQKKAEKQAQKLRDKADKAHDKAVDKANEKARKAIEKADKEREKALEAIETL